MRRVLSTWVTVVTGEVVLLAAGRVGSGLQFDDPTLSTDQAVFACLRLVGLAVGAYLLVVLTVGAALRVFRLGALVRWSDVLTPGVVRALLDRSLGVVVAGGVVMAAALGPVAPANASQGPPITLRGLRGPTRSTEATTTTTVLVPPTAPVAEEPVTVPMEPVTPVEPMERVEPVAEPPPSKPPAVAYPPAPSPPTSDGRTWPVQRGDHFWSIAQRVLAEARGRPVAAAEVGPYWRTLVADNRSRLADPDNPDLLFAGQVLTVPPPPPPPP